MKITLFRTLCLMVAVLLWNGCSKSSGIGGDNSPLPEPEPYPEEPQTIIPLYELRNLHTGEDLSLTKDMMSGAYRLAVVVTSDHTADNLPQGWLIAQDSRSQGGLRGITIPLEHTDASKYVPGDSLVIDIEGGILTRVNNHLQLTNIQADNIVKIASRRRVLENRMSIENIIANPSTYESTFVTIEGALGFLPASKRGDTMSGNKTLVRGSGQLTISTDVESSLAALAAPITARFSGLLFNSDNGPILRIRTEADMDIVTEFEPIDPNLNVPAFVISGWMADPAGDDKNHEYIQFLALRDIDFSATPYAIVTTNNAGGSTPTGIPVNGWATGGTRTYKINITSGTAKKGTYFYVGGTEKLINGAGSASIADANWVRIIDYVNNDGDGFGTKVNGLLADCGNPSGIAVFKGTEVTVDTEPTDVVFIRHTWPNPLNIIGEDDDGVTRGFKITDTDHYKKENGDYFYQLVNGNRVNDWAVRYNGNCSNLAPGRFWNVGGVYNISTKKWTTVRRTGDANTNSSHPDHAELHISSPQTLSDIEKSSSTKLVE